MKSQETIKTAKTTNDQADPRRASDTKNNLDAIEALGPAPGSARYTVNQGPYTLGKNNYGQYYNIVLSPPLDSVIHLLVPDTYGASGKMKKVKMWVTGKALPNIFPQLVRELRGLKIPSRRSKLNGR